MIVWYMPNDGGIEVTRYDPFVWDVAMEEFGDVLTDPDPSDCHWFVPFTLTPEQMDG